MRATLVDDNSASRLPRGAVFLEVDGDSRARGYELHLQDAGKKFDRAEVLRGRHCGELVRDSGPQAVHWGVGHHGDRCLLGPSDAAITGNGLTDEAQNVLAEHAMRKELCPSTPAPNRRTCRARANILRARAAHRREAPSMPNDVPRTLAACTICKSPACRCDVFVRPRFGLRARFSNPPNEDFPRAAPQTFPSLDEDGKSVDAPPRSMAEGAVPQSQPASPPVARCFRALPSAQACR